MKKIKVKIKSKNKKLVGQKEYENVMKKARNNKMTSET